MGEEDGGVDDEPAPASVRKVDRGGSWDVTDSHGGRLPSSIFTRLHSTTARTHSALDIPHCFALSVNHSKSSSFSHTSSRAWPCRCTDTMYVQ